MCSHLTLSNATNEDPVIVYGCGREQAERTGCSATFGVRPWLGIGNGYYIQKVATFRNEQAQQAFGAHIDAFLAKTGVKRA